MRLNTRKQSRHDLRRKRRQDDADSKSGRLTMLQRVTSKHRKAKVSYAMLAVTRITAELSH
jgi:hypothetical protein